MVTNVSRGIWLSLADSLVIPWLKQHFLLKFVNFVTQFFEDFWVGNIALAKESAKYLANIGHIG
jgi:hypothetical protein